MFGSRNPYTDRPPSFRWPRLTLAALAAFILVVFIVDKLVLSPSTPPAPIPLATVIDHLNRHDVRRVTIPASEVTVELNDGKKLTTTVSADRDLWPSIKRSEADVTIVAAQPVRTGETSTIGAVFQFVPFIIMALLLLFILRTARARQA